MSIRQHPVLGTLTGGVLLASLIGCGGAGVEDRAANAAGALDEDLFTDVEMEVTPSEPYIEAGGIDQFEVTLIPGADLQDAGENLGTLLNDYGVMPTVHLEDGTE